MESCCSFWLSILKHLGHLTLMPELRSRTADGLEWSVEFRPISATRIEVIIKVHTVIIILQFFLGNPISPASISFVDQFDERDPVD